MQAELNDWVKVVRDGNTFKEDIIIYGQVVALGYYEEKPIVTVCINMQKFLTVASELIVEVRKSNAKSN